MQLVGWLDDLSTYRMLFSSQSTGVYQNRNLQFATGIRFLDGGFKHFLFSPRTLGKWSNLTVAYFWDRLVKNHQLGWKMPMKSGISSTKGGMSLSLTFQELIDPSAHQHPNNKKHVPHLRPAAPEAFPIKRSIPLSWRMRPKGSRALVSELLRGSYQKMSKVEILLMAEIRLTSWGW